MSDLPEGVRGLGSLFRAATLEVKLEPVTLGDGEWLGGRSRDPFVLFEPTGNGYVVALHGARFASRGGRHTPKAGQPYEPTGLEDVTFHSLRHTFASLLIAQGRDPVFVSRQLGHADPSITLKVYSHLFNAARHASEARDELERDFGVVLRLI